MGFPDDLYISDLMAIQKQRLGGKWWLFPIIAILGSLILLIFSVWLTVHITTYNVGGLKEKSPIQLIWELKIPEQKVNKFGGTK